MRLLLTQNLIWWPAHGGANKSNRRLMEHLAADGHETRAVVPAVGLQGDRSEDRLLASLEDAGIEVRVSEDTLRFRLHGVDVHAVRDATRLPAILAERIRDFRPDRVLVTSEDPEQILLGEALEARDRAHEGNASPPFGVVYLAHTPLMLPFGDFSFLPSRAGRERLGRADGILTVSRYLREIIEDAGLDATVLPLPVYLEPGEAPSADLHRFGEGAVTTINLSSHKGVDLFRDLAESFPEVPFAGVASWGTGRAERRALEVLPNVEVLEPVDDVDEIFRRTRVLLVPSLWQEAFGYVVVEAMLRGIPVLAADHGGLRESALGAAELLPVRPIRELTDRLDERGNPVPVVPPQDPEPWRAALARLLGDREAYEDASRRCRRAALDFVQEVSARPIARYLEALTPADRATPAATAPTPARAVGGLDRVTRSRLAAELLRLRGPAETDGTASARAIPRLSRQNADFPLSPSQERLWLLDRLEPGTSVYNETVATRLRGRARHGALGQSLEEIVRRHEVLRSTLEERGGEPRQVVGEDAAVPLPVVDLSGLSATARDAVLNAALRAEGSRGFDLARGPLLRTRLWRLAPDEHVLQVTAHHAVSDGWSMGVFIRELGVFYRAFVAGQGTAEPEPAVQYVDFAAWQRRRLGRVEDEDGVPGVEAQIDFWRRRLEGVPATLELPRCGPRPDRPSAAGAVTTRQLSPPLTAALEALARDRGATPYMVLLAALGALLSRYSGQLNLTVGSPVAGRARPELEGLVGFFLNLLVMRLRLEGAPTFAELVDRARETALAAYENQEVPFERLLEELQPERSLGRTPLFQVLLNVHNFTDVFGESGTLRLPGLELEAIEPFPPASKFDLAVYAVTRPEGLFLRAVYRTDLYSEEQVAGWLSDLESVLKTGTEAPRTSLSELLSADRGRAGAAAVAESAETPLTERLAARAQEAGGHPALVDHDGVWTYRELWDAVRAQASGWAESHPGDSREAPVPVALLFEHGAPMIVAMLGCLAAGRPYVPLDPYMPPERARAILDDCGARFLLTGTSLHRDAVALAGDGLEVLTADALRGSGALPPRADDGVAYVLYTSGSTGRAKGVLQSRSHLLRHARLYADSLSLTGDDRLALLASYAFDASVMDIYGALAAGATVVVLDLKRHTLEELADLLDEHRVSVYHSTPTVFRLLTQGLDPERTLGTVRAVVLGGEKAQASDRWAFRRHFATGAVLINGLGPTESTLALQHRETGAETADGGIPDDRALPVGRPVPETEVRLVNPAGPQVAAWGVGEIRLVSDRLALGYLGDPAKTAAAFVPAEGAPAPGVRAYRTGDLGRWWPGGVVEWVGRKDQQVKIRGYRVEPGEVEDALAGLDGVAEVAVVTRPSGEGFRLVAYLRPDGDTAPTGPELRAALRRRLPDYMIPAHFEVLRDLPHTATGKIDRRGLPDPVSDTAPRAPSAPPRTDTEKRLAAIWEAVLECPPVGRDDHFFDLGGHSLRASRVVSRVREAFSVELPLAVVFETPRLHRMAAALDARLEAAKPAAGPSTEGPAARRAPELRRLPRRGRRVKLRADGTPDVSADDLEALLASPRSSAPLAGPPPRTLDLSLFFFSADASAGGGAAAPVDRYELLERSVRFADRNGFKAVWTPERHFNEFGGLYPNPSLTSAALARITERIELRAGSVVLPLHDPLRVAEEWSVVDNLSGGRVGIAFASGWHVNDFALRPEAYEHRREILWDGIAAVRELWRGGSVRRRNGVGNEVELKIFPPPVQPELPTWITCQSERSFQAAAEHGYDVLTNLNYKSVDQLGERIRAYRRARWEAGHETPGRVALMLHTFVCEDLDNAWHQLRTAYDGYLLTNFALQMRLVQGAGATVELSDDDREFVMEKAFERLVESHGLVGTPSRCRAKLEQFAAAGVDEVACLIDFGLDLPTLLSSLDLLRGLRVPIPPREAPAAPALQEAAP